MVQTGPVRVRVGSQKLHTPPRIIAHPATEATMAKKATQPEKSFAVMTSGEKARFIGKALVFFVSGGFIFPTMWIE